jgi:hypothetical protein
LNLSTTDLATCGGRRTLLQLGAGIRLRIHDLRHTAASLLIASGANVKAVQSQLGHKSATTTLDRYGHLIPENLDRLRGGNMGPGEAAEFDTQVPHWFGGPALSDAVPPFGELGKLTSQSGAKMAH